MTTKSNSFVDPSSLSLPSPMSSPSSPPSTDNVAGPSRKRQRTDMSPEERKEQRAHRNRIAAQNSRDRRKAQYSALERRVAELEEENRQLRAGVVLSDLHRSNDSQSERDRERDRENAELRERVKSLEKGWEVFIKALAAQGLSLPPVSQTSSSSSSPSSSSSVTTPTSTTTSTADSNTNSITTFPVLVPSSPVFPITPSPTISASSMCLEVDEPESTCHLARVASVPAIPPETPLQRTPLGVATPTDVDDAAVDAWIHEIFKASPVLTQTVLPDSDLQEPAVSLDASASSGTAMIGQQAEAVPEWENGVEMQRILDMLPLIQSTEEGDTSTGLDLDLCGGWNFISDITPTMSGVGVF